MGGEGTISATNDQDFSVFGISDRPSVSYERRHLGRSKGILSLLWSLIKTDEIIGHQGVLPLADNSSGRSQFKSDETSQLPLPNVIEISDQTLLHPRKVFDYLLINIPTEKYYWLMEDVISSIHLDASSNPMRCLSFHWNGFIHFPIQSLSQIHECLKLFSPPVETVNEVKWCDAMFWYSLWMTAMHSLSWCVWKILFKRGLHSTFRTISSKYVSKYLKYLAMLLTNNTISIFYHRKYHWLEV